METLSNNAPVIIPSTVGVPARKDAVHILAISVAGALGKSSTTTDLVSESTDGNNVPPVLELTSSHAAPPVHQFWL